MADIKKNTQIVYDALTSSGVTGIGDNAEQFRKLLEKDENRRKVYDALVSHNMTGIGKDYDEFSSLVYEAPTQTRQQVTQREQAAAPIAEQAVVEEETPAAQVPSRRPVTSHVGETDSSRDRTKRFNAMVRERENARYMAMSDRERRRQEAALAGEAKRDEEKREQGRKNMAEREAARQQAEAERREQDAQHRKELEQAAAAIHEESDELIQEYERRLKENEENIDPDPNNRKRQENVQWLTAHKEAYRDAKRKLEDVEGEINLQDRDSKLGELFLKKQELINSVVNPGDYVPDVLKPIIRSNPVGLAASTIVPMVARAAQDPYKEAAVEFLSQAEQEWRTGSSAEKGYKGSFLERAWTAAKQFVEGGANNFDRGSLTMGASEGGAAILARTVGDKSDKIVNETIKGLGYTDEGAKEVRTGIEEKGKALAKVAEDMNAAASELEAMKATIEGGGADDAYIRKYNQKIREYNKRLKDEYQPALAAYEEYEKKYKTITSAIDAALASGLSEGETALLDALTEFTEAKVRRANDKSIAAAAGAGAEQSAEFMLDFILTGGLTEAGEKMATRWTTNHLMRKLGKDALLSTVKKPSLWAKMASDVVVSGARTAVMVPRNLQAYGEQLTEFAGKDEFGRYNFNRSYLNAALNTALTQYIEYWSEGFGEYFGAGEQALFKQVTGRSPVTAIGKTLSQYRGSIGMYLDYGKFDGMFNEMLEEVVGSSFNALAGWASKDKVGDKDALKEFFAGEQLATLALSFLPMTAISTATNVSAYHKMKRRYDDGVKVLNRYIDAGAVKREELEELVTDIEGKTPEEIKDKIVEIADKARAASGGRLPKNFTQSLLGYVEGTFAMRMNNDAWQDSQEKMTVVNAYASQYDNPDSRNAYDLAEAEAEARRKAAAAGIGDDILELDSYAIARQAQDLRETDGEQAALLMNYAVAKASMDGLRNGYKEETGSISAAFGDAIDEQVSGRDVIVANAGEDSVVITSQDASVGADGSVTTPTGPDGLVTFMTEDGRMFRAKASALTGARQMDKDTFLFDVETRFSQSREEEWDNALNTMSPAAKARAIQPLLGATAYISGNGAYEPVRIERLTHDGAAVVISGDKEALKGVAEAIGISGPGGTMLEVPTDNLYDLLAKDDDGKISTDAPAVPDGGEAAPDGEGGAPGVVDDVDEGGFDPSELVESEVTVTIGGEPTNVFVTDVADGKVYYQYEGKDGAQRTDSMSEKDFRAAMRGESPGGEGGGPAAPAEPEDRQEWKDKREKGRSVLVGKEITLPNGVKGTVNEIRDGVGGWMNDSEGNVTSVNPFSVSVTTEGGEVVGYDLSEEDFDRLVAENEAPADNGGEGPSIPTVEVNGKKKKVYDDPSVTPEMAYDDIYGDVEEGSKDEQNADKFVSNRTRAAKQALEDAKTEIDAAEAEKAKIDDWDIKDDEDLDDFRERKAEAKKKIDDRVAETRASIPELQRKAAFWDEMNEVVEAHEKRRENEAKEKEEEKRKKLIEKYGVDTSGFDLNPQTVEEAVAAYLGGSVGIISLDDAIRETLGRRKDGRIPAELFKHIGRYGILAKRGGRTIQDVADEIVREFYGDTEHDDEGAAARDYIINFLVGNTKKELQDYIFNVRLKAAIDEKEYFENADPVELATEGRFHTGDKVAFPVPGEGGETSNAEGVIEGVDEANGGGVVVRMADGSTVSVDAGVLAAPAAAPAAQAPAAGPSSGPAAPAAPQGPQAPGNQGGGGIMPQNPPTSPKKELPLGGETVSAGTKAVMDEAKKLGFTPVVIRKVEDIPASEERAAKVAREQGLDKIRAWVNTDTKQVFVVEGNISEAEAEGVVMHEVVTHIGLRDMLGEEDYNALCDAVWDGMSEEDSMLFGLYALGVTPPSSATTREERVAWAKGIVSQFSQADIDRINSEKVSRKAAGEYMASLAEKSDFSTEDRGVWQRIKDAVRTFLTRVKLSMGKEISDEDLRSLIMASRDVLVAKAQTEQQRLESLFAMPESALSQTDKDRMLEIMEMAGVDEADLRDARRYLSGENTGLIARASYFQSKQKALDYVRSRPGNLQQNRGAGNGSQLDERAPENQGPDGGVEGGGPSVGLDSGTGGAALPEGGNGSAAGGDGAPGADGERGNSGVPGNGAGSVGNASAGEQSGGSRGTGGNGQKPRTGRTGGRNGGGNAGQNNGRGAEAKPDVASATGEVDSILAELDGLGSDATDFALKGAPTAGKLNEADRKEGAITLEGKSPEQVSLIAKLGRALAKAGYALVQDGIRAFNLWAAQMKNRFGQKLKENKVLRLTDEQVDRYIEEIWDTDFEIDGRVMRVREWAEELGEKALRDVVKMIEAEKRKLQKAADKVVPKFLDMANIREMLPFLLPEQQEDVLKAETQFFDPSHQDKEHGNGKGYLFTNATGTGKTFTGAGIIKRFVKSGRGRVLIITPTQNKVSDWISEGTRIDLEINALESTSDAGKGCVVTTYANFRENEEIMNEDFDLIVYDESHNITKSLRGTETEALKTHYQLSNRDEEYAMERLTTYAPFFRQLHGWEKKVDENRAKVSEYTERMLEDGPVLTLKDGTKLNLQSEIAKLERETNELQRKINEAQPHIPEETEKLRPRAKAATEKTKVVFLSASAFATHASLRYAEGYIFSFPELERKPVGEDRSSLEQMKLVKFLLDRFPHGYRRKNSKQVNAVVSDPDKLEDEEVAFTEYLFNGLNTASGRMLSTKFDYARTFPTLPLDMADRVNGACNAILTDSRLAPLKEAYKKTFEDYTYGNALLETMKASLAVPRIKQHLAKGRKVVIFHSRLSSKEAIEPPFQRILELAETLAKGDTSAVTGAQILFRNMFPDVLAWEQKLNYEMPREQLSKAFGAENVLLYSGQETGKAKEKNVEKFQDDNSGKNIIIVQTQSGSEGISLHDKTGKHQRVIVNLSLPRSPITAIQGEGRTLRIGSESNAIFEYPLLGLNFETNLFANVFAGRAGTQENLSMGPMARGLRDSFMNGVLEHSGVVDIDEDTGGKAYDAKKRGGEATYEDAITYYHESQTSPVDGEDQKDGMPTPEPLGFMMVKWAGLQEGESVLEPSVGRGAIARFIPKTNRVKGLDTNGGLISRIKLKLSGSGRNFEVGDFKDFDIHNKYDAAIMSPPFGEKGSDKAYLHVSKAFKHMVEGGRVVAIVPADTDFSKLDETAMVSGEVLLPAAVSGERGPLKVVIIDKVSRKGARARMTESRKVDLSDAANVNDFFARLRDVEMPGRKIDDSAKVEKCVNAVKKALKVEGKKGVISEDMTPWVPEVRPVTKGRLSRYERDAKVEELDDDTVVGFEVRFIKQRGGYVYNLASSGDYGRFLVYNDERLRKEIKFVKDKVESLSRASDNGRLRRSGDHSLEYYEKILDSLLKTAGITEEDVDNRWFEMGNLTPEEQAVRDRVYESSDEEIQELYNGYYEQWRTNSGEVARNALRMRKIVELAKADLQDGTVARKKESGWKALGTLSESEKQLRDRLRSLPLMQIKATQQVLDTQLSEMSDKESEGYRSIWRMSKVAESVHTDLVNEINGILANYGYELKRQGNTEGLAKFFKDFSEDKDNSALFEKLLPVISRFGTKVLFTDNYSDSTLGSYKPGDDQLLLNASHVKDKAEMAVTIIHELIHDATTYAQHGRERGKISPDSELGKAALQTNRLWQALLLSTSRPSWEYPLSNDRELLAGITDAGFRSWLESVDVYVDNADNPSRFSVFASASTPVKSNGRVELEKILDRFFAAASPYEHRNISVPSDREEVHQHNVQAERDAERREDEEREAGLLFRDGEGEVFGNNANFAHDEREDNRAGAAHDARGQKGDDGTDAGGPNRRKMEIRRDKGRIRVLEARVAAERPEYPSSSEGDFARRSDQEKEGRRLIEAAKANGMFIEPGTFSGLERVRRSSRESIVYHDAENGRAIKILDPFSAEAMTGNSPFDELYRHIIHNLFFPEARYEFVGVTTNARGDEVRFVLAQPWVDSYDRVWDVEADEFIKKHGFGRLDGYKRQNEDVVVFDFYGSNILKDSEGNIYLIDPLFSFKRDPRAIIDDYLAEGEDLRYRDGEYSGPERIEDNEEYGSFIHAATAKNAQYKGKAPFENFVFTANKCYLYNTSETDIFPVKVWDIEADREQINAYTDAIERRIRDGRYKGPLDRLLAEVLGQEGNDFADSADARGKAERNASTDGVYPGQQSDGTRNHSASDSAGRSGLSGDSLFREETDEDVLERLDSEPTVTAYRAMQFVPDPNGDWEYDLGDGKGMQKGFLYPPMSAKVDGAWRAPVKRGTWERSVEDPSKVREDGRFWLDRGDEGGVWAAYNPYLHSSDSMLNDQFKKAQSRSNLVVVEVQVPAREVAENNMNPYHAEKAKDAVGKHEWNAGIIQKQLSGTRNVYLSRWDKPSRIVPVGEVADNVANMVRGQVDEMPSNVVWPQLRAELEKRGIPFVETDNQGNYTEGDRKGTSYETAHSAKNRLSKEELRKQEKERKAAKDEMERARQGVIEAERKSVEKTLDSMSRELGIPINRVPRSAMPVGHKSAKGYYNPNTGEMTICMDNVTDERDAIATVLHETVGHHGLRGLFGSRFNEAMVSIYAHLDGKGRRWISSYMRRHGLKPGEADSIITGMEEYLSHLAESGDFKNSVWDDIKEILGRIVDAIFGTDGFVFTDRELNYILRASYEHLKNPNWLNTMQGKALDTLMKRELGINETDPHRPTDPEGPGAGLLYRDSDSSLASEDYDFELNRWSNEMLREFQDADRPVKIGMEKVMKEVGKDLLEEDEDYLTRHNLASSRAETESHDFELFHFKPMLKQVRRIQSKLLGDRSGRTARLAAYERILDYIYAVHGLERNASKNEEIEQAKQAAIAAVTDPAEIAAIEKRYEDMKKDWSGLTSLMGRPKEEWREAEDDARAMANAFEAEVGSDMTDDLWYDIRSCTDYTLDHAYKYGLLTRDEYEKLHGTESKPRMWEHYVPLRGFAEKTAESLFSYSSFAQTSASGVLEKKMKGRWTEADNPLANILNMAETEIVQGNDNWAKQALYNFTIRAGENSLLTVRQPWYVKDVTTGDWMLAEPYDVDPATGKPETLEHFESRMKELSERTPKEAKLGRRGLKVGKIIANKAHRNEHLIRLKVNGMDKAIWVNGNPAFATAVSGSGRGQNYSLLRRAGRAISNLFTTYSIDFAAKNLIRDTAYSQIALHMKEDKPYRRRYMKNWIRNFGYGAFAFPMIRLAAMWESGSLQDKLHPTKMEQDFIDFMHDGGQTGYTIINSVDKIKKELERSMRRAGQKTGKVTVPILGHYGELVKALNEAFELLTRFTTYQTSRDMGRSGQRAASDAKEISVNFNRRGAQDNSGLWGIASAYLGASHYFFNAGVQGFDNFCHLFKVAPYKMTAITGAAAGMAIFTPMINAMLAGLVAGLAGGDGDDDDEKKAEWYWNLPEWVRRNNIILGTGEWYMAIPLPVELRAFYGVGDIVGSTLLYQKYPNHKFGRVAGDIISTASGLLPVNPVDGFNGNGNIGDAVIRGLAPDVTMFFVDWATNRDYTGRPLAKENPFSKVKPVSQGAYASTPKALVDACQAIGQYTGADIAPGVVRDFLNSYFGGFYRAAEDVSKLATGAFGNDPERPFRYDDIPFFSGFTGHIDEDRSNSFASGALHDYKDLSESVVKKMNLAERSGDITASDAYKNPDSLPKGARVQKILSGKDYELGKMYYDGVHNKYKMKQYQKGDKIGQWYQSKEVEIPGVDALKKDWEKLRDMWAAMPDGTQEEKDAKDAFSLDVQEAWHKYYSAERDLVDRIMAYEYGEDISVEKYYYRKVKDLVD